MGDTSELPVFAPKNPLRRDVCAAVIAVILRSVVLPPIPHARRQPLLGVLAAK